MSKIDALIMAGAPADADMNPSGGVISRAMVGLGDKTMLQWIVDALRGSQSVGRIAAVGDVQADGLDIIIKPGDDLVSNIKLGINALDTREPVLVLSCDIPLITSEAIDDFVVCAADLDADMAYPIILKSDCVARYPQLARTYLKTAEGTFTGGNLMLLRPEFLARNWDTIEKAYAARKQPTRLARMIGIGTLLRVVVGQLVFPGAISVATLEKAVSRLVNGRVRAVFSSYPEIGEDVDKAADLAAVKEILLAK